MTPRAPWYPISAMTRAKTLVRVRWAWWQGEALLLANPGKPRQWLMPVGEPGARRLVPLPPRNVRVFWHAHMGETLTVGEDWLERNGWGPEPHLWQPVGAWPEPLPAPVATVGEKPRFVSIGGMRFSATEAAAEMEAEREEARRAPREAREAIELPWWRDATQLTYSPAGSIGLREAEGRVMRALYFLGGGEAWEIAAGSNAGVLADLKHAAEVASGDATEDYIPRFEAGPADTPDRLLMAMRWVCEMRLDPACDGQRRYRVLDARARNVPVTFAAIGEAFGLSRPRARQIYTAAIARIAVIANAGTPLIDARVAAIQTDNRRARNR